MEAKKITNRVKRISTLLRLDEDYHKENAAEDLLELEADLVKLFAIPTVTEGILLAKTRKVSYREFEDLTALNEWIADGGVDVISIKYNYTDGKHCMYFWQSIN